MSIHVRNSMAGGARERPNAKSSFMRMQSEAGERFGTISRKRTLMKNESILESKDEMDFDDGPMGTVNDDDYESERDRIITELMQVAMQMDGGNRDRMQTIIDLEDERKIGRLIDRNYRDEKIPRD